MFGKHIHVSSLEIQKRLLVAESDLNRAQLAEQWQGLAHEVGDLAHRVTTVGTWVSSATVLVAGLLARRNPSPPPATAKSSWLQKVLQGACLASTIRLAFRASGQKEASR